MGILRTDIVSHSQLEATGGSLELDGVGDYLTFGAHSSFAPATADVTFELWFYLTDQSDFSAGSGNYYFFDMGSNGYRIQMYEGLIRFGVDGSNWTPPASGVSKNVWHHVAGVRESNSLDLYLDGNHVGQKTMTSSVTSTSLTIGNYGGAPYDGEPYGYISNFRYVRGVVYKGPFTPPKFELKNIPGTIVLGCQSSSSATDFAVTPSTITAQGNATSSAFHPGLKKDITDTGVVFDGVTTFDSQAYFVPPSGKTTERNRGRAIMAGGMKYPTANAEIIEMLEIQSGGLTQDFGDLTTATSTSGPVSSSTRGVIVAGLGPSARTNVIEFVTIANASNSTDFGDYVEDLGYVGGVSNETRGVTAGGNGPNSPTNTNQIGFITIATTGNAQNFGDLTQRSAGVMGVQSSTRGVFNIGSIHDGSYGFTNAIEFITIASAGDAQDFGDLSRTNSAYGGACCSSTRGLFAGGYNNTPAPVTEVNNIDFITIASTGNSTDFGDLVTAGFYCFGTSNKTRGIFQGRLTTAPTSGDPIIDSVIISSTGNAVEFGQMHRMDSGPADGQAIKRRGATTMSDSHGGLS